ncbi:hypothetical protein QJS04_geneDACA005877 [Acorus gramineus]|uniref:Uncharacterized protein n=1 Tax=Acorus gramineus TaxID=55184 RepID=A0AAV9B2P7_ACOGR|nr:hypothetical protein QJS04_geneDACA005877 [Acorus gramineus]
MAPRWRASSILSSIVTVHPHEVSSLIHSSSCRFFVSPLESVYTNISTMYFYNVIIYIDLLTMK